MGAGSEPAFLKFNTPETSGLAKVGRLRKLQYPARVSNTLLSVRSTLLYKRYFQLGRDGQEMATCVLSLLNVTARFG